MEPTQYRAPYTSSIGKTMAAKVNQNILDNIILKR